VESAAVRVARFAEKLIEAHHQFAHTEVLGPAESPFFKLKGKFRYQILLKSPQHAVLTALCEKLQEFKFTGVSLTVDIDPINML
jgi:primosomal protein N' (replication factor Y)